jgi:hypothetical protein
LAILSLLLAMVPQQATAGECPSPSSEIATDRPDVTNSSQVMPVGSLQGENGINSTGNGIDKTFDGTNSRLRLGVASCFEIMVDLPTYVGRLQGSPDSGYTNVIPAVNYQLSSLPESWNISVTAGAGLPTGATAITGPGVQPYLQFPWSHQLGNGWGTSGMLTTFFFPSDPLNHETTEATFAVEKKVSERVSCLPNMSVTFPRAAAMSSCSTSAGNIC